MLFGPAMRLCASAKGGTTKPFFQVEGLAILAPAGKTPPTE
jgi:hypothetical protein